MEVGPGVRAAAVHRHFKALVKETSAKESWEIAPQTVKGEIAKFPAQVAAAKYLRPHSRHLTASFRLLTG